MKTDSEHEELLNDLFGEERRADGLPGALALMLHAARGRRQWRRAARGIAAALVLAAGILVSRVALRSRPEPAGRPPTSYTMVNTRPLPSTEVVATVPLTPDLLVSTVGETQMVRSTSLGYSEMSDEELLTLVAARPAVLVRSRSGFEHLVFVNPDDAQGFPVN
jgi:hypothetical protein